jgi:hypothetical protein
VEISDVFLARFPDTIQAYCFYTRLQYEGTGEKMARKT